MSLYFVYVFINKKDAPLKHKVLFGIIFLPLIIILPTQLNLSAFNITECYSLENNYGLYYKYFIEIISSITIVLFSIIKIKRADDFSKKQLIILLVGIMLFLFSFFSAVFLGSYLADQGWNMAGYSFEMYGLFGAVVFMGFLAYLIVKFKAFDIKMIGAQALVVTLVMIIGSQFAFIQNSTNKILTALTLTLAVIFGWILIRSVKREVKQREELEIANGEIEKRNEAILERNDKLKKANKEISERKEQLQKMADSLAIANDKLQKLDMAKTEFVSMASHQLRTPPTPIKGYSSMLLEGSYGELNAEQRKAIENISNANNQQIAFVEDLLSVSRIESGSLKFQFEKCHIEEFCQEVIDNLALKAKDKNLYLDYKIPAKPLPEITIDGAKVREVISNLVDNAIKYTLKGGVTLYVELCAKKETGCLKKPHLRITVSDTGIGIPADEIPYLFAKFSRGKDTTRLNTGGTGLGLYVVKMITEANGGKVWIESPGANLGTKFILELPLEPEKETLERNG
jgi:signal transduction histidine kinase